MTTALPLAERYARFRDEVFSGLEESTLPGLAEPLSEMDLQSLWFSGAFGSQFETTDGKLVRLVDFGEWNSGAGPDFAHCAVEIDGVLHKGDIELDPDARDWERHAHGANPAYACVVLHLFMEAPEEKFFTRNSDHRFIPQVRLSAASLPGSAKPNRGLAAARLGRCHTPLSEMEASRIQSLLESSAQFRLERKSERLHRSVEAQGREQAVFQALAQTLGYRNNQQPFQVLAQRLPVKKLKKLPPLEAESLLFGVSGFLESVVYEDTLPETRVYLRGLWSEWWKQRDAAAQWMQAPQKLTWKLAAIRPGNHPQRRLGALTAMLRRWSAISGPLMDAGRWSQDSWRETLLSLTHEFWSSHYTLLAERAAKPLALVGETRVQEMLANVAYPLLLPERTRLWAEYLELPALLDNQKVRRAALRLFGDETKAAPFLKKLHHHQGLLQIYEDFCLEDDSACADCPFPERLKQWPV